MRWGIAAPGGIAASMATALGDVEGAEITAVGSRSAERAEAFARRFSIPHAHGSYAALFADPDVDIVYVAAPHSAHCELTIAALEAGKHVLCEKAFAVNAAEARRMVAAAEGAERFLMEAMWTWFLPPIVELQARVEAGAIGEVRVVQADFSIAVPGEVGRHRELALAGGALLDLGIYPVALARLLLGEPTAVRALGHLGPTGVDANLAAVLSYENDALALFHTGLDARSSLTAHITGTEGTISVDAPFWCPGGFTIDRHAGTPERVVMAHSGLAHEAAHAMERIAAGHRESDVIPLATSVSMMETLDEIRRQVGVVYPADGPST